MRSCSNVLALFALVSFRLAVLYREVSSGLYSRLAYGFGQLLADIPFHILNALVMFVMFYFIVGFQREGPLIGYFILMTFAANWVIMSLGQFFALAMPNEGTCVVVGS